MPCTITLSSSKMNEDYHLSLQEGGGKKRDDLDSVPSQSHFISITFLMHSLKIVRKFIPTILGEVGQFAESSWLLLLRILQQPVLSHEAAAQVCATMAHAPACPRAPPNVCLLIKWALFKN